jgi:hypothetical protein
MSETYIRRFQSASKEETLKRQAEAAGLRDFQIQDVLDAYEWFGWERALLTLNYLKQTTQPRCWP